MSFPPVPYHLAGMSLTRRGSESFIQEYYVAFDKKMAELGTRSLPPPAPSPVTATAPAPAANAPRDAPPPYSARPPTDLMD